jgi:hypothetical protein
VPHTFVTGDPLPASDLNSFVLQPGTSGTGTRLVAGKTSYTMTAINGINVTVSWGFTFSAAPSVTFSIVSGSNIDLVGTFAGTPSTTGCTIRVAERDGTAVTQSGSIHWHAVGAP